MHTTLNVSESLECQKKKHSPNLSGTLFSSKSILLFLYKEKMKKILIIVVASLSFCFSISTAKPCLFNEVKMVTVKCCYLECFGFTIVLKMFHKFM